MEDPCIKCDDREKYDSFLEENSPQTPAPKEPDDSHLLLQVLERYKEYYLKYKHLMENAPGAIIIADIETEIILEANNKAAELLGVPLDRIIGEHMSQLHPPEEAQKYTELFRKHAQMDSPHILEDVELCSSDGKKTPVQIAMSTAQFGDQMALYGFFRDVTEQKEIWDQLKTSEQQLKAVFESSQDCILVWDKDYNYLYANQAAIDHVNTTRDKVIGKNIRDGLGHIPDFMNLWMGRVDEVFKTGKPMHVEDAVPVDDRLVYSESVLSPIRHSDGEMFAVSAVYRDVTKQKVIQERFRRLSQATFEGIIFHDNGIPIESNQQFADMFGYSLDEISGLCTRDIFSSESCKVVDEKIAAGDPGPYEATCQRKDGSTFPVEIRARVIQLKGKKSRVAAFRDLTEQKQLQQQLADSERLYKDLYRNAKAALYRTRLSDGKLLACSAALANLYGYDSTEDCLANHFSKNHYVDKDRRKQLLDKLQKDNHIENFQTQVRRLDGSKIWVALTAELCPEKNWIEGAIVDITASKILTQTEMKILEIILAGKSNKEIAYGLKRSIRTIEDHRSHIMHKLGVDNVVDLTRKALKYGITPDGE